MTHFDRGVHAAGDKADNPSEERGSRTVGERADHPSAEGGSRPEAAAGRARAPAWTRLVPSVGDFTLIAVLSLLLKLPPYDTDLWWHLKTGDWILAHHAVPHVDVFSFTALGAPWIAHEWLAEIGLALLWRASGVAGMGAFQALAIVVVLALMYRHLSTDGAPGIVSVPLLLGVMLLLMPSAHPRPYLLTLVGLALLQLLVRGSPTRRTYVLVPLLFVVWANVHAGFALGLVWLGLACFGELWRQRSIPFAHGFLLMLATGAAVVNPNGYRLLLYPLAYGTGSAHYRYLVEWSSPDFHLAFNWLVEAYLLAAVAAVLVVRPRGWRRGVLVVLVFGHLALLSVRNIPVFAVVAAPYIGAAAAAALARRRRVPRTAPGPTGEPATTFVSRVALKLRAVCMFDAHHHPLAWTAFVLIVVAASTFSMGYPPENWDPAAAPGTRGLDFPYEAVDYLAAHDLAGNLLNDYGWGGYVIWSLYPDRPVFIDGRTDVYGERITTDYAAMVGLRPGWRERLDDYDIQHVLLKPDTPLAQALSIGCGWQVRFEDNRSQVLSRTGHVCP